MAYSLAYKLGSFWESAIEVIGSHRQIHSWSPSSEISGDAVRYNHNKKYKCWSGEPNMFHCYYPNETHQRNSHKEIGKVSIMSVKTKIMKTPWTHLITCRFVSSGRVSLRGFHCKKVVPLGWFEHPTPSLRMMCSTNWAKAAQSLLYKSPTKRKVGDCKSLVKAVFRGCDIFASKIFF